MAAASGTRVERIMRFAHPVLQERARVAEQAQDARVRLSEGTPSTTLARFMAERLRLLDTDVDDVQWDAHRDHDGAWLVTGAWRAGDKSGTTRWTFDLPARIVTPYDAATTDFAEGTRLVRVVPDVPTGLTGIPVHRSRPVSMLRDNGRPEAGGRSAADADADQEDDDHADLLATDVRPDVPVPDFSPGFAAATSCTDVLQADLIDEDDDVRDVHPAAGRSTTTDRSRTCSTRWPTTTRSCWPAPRTIRTTRTRGRRSRRGRTSSSGSAGTAEPAAGCPERNSFASVTTCA